MQIELKFIKSSQQRLILIFEEYKHTKISSEEISDGRKYSLLFLYDKVEVSC